ncbi:MAG: TraB/GumN family protein, partial [Bdellovibrionota bacterium]
RGRAEVWALPNFTRMDAGDMDAELAAYGLKNGKIAGFLEKDVLTRGPCAYVIETELLEKGVREIMSQGKNKSNPDDMKKAYRRGDVTKLNQSVFSTVTNDCIFRARHENWIFEIEQRLRALSPIVFAVGVTHLTVDKDSLPSMLETQGFKVRKLEAPTKL